MRKAVFLQGLISFLIVAFGQPSFAPWLGPVAALVGYALFWRAIRIYPFRYQKFWRGVLWYGSISLIQLSWMTSIEFQGPYILAVWGALALWVGIQFGLLSLLIPYNRPPTFPRILAIASVWTLLEWSRYHFLCGYSWNLSGLALSNSLAIQLASVFGVLGLTFWVLFSNLLGLRAFLKKGISSYTVWLGVAAVPYLFGAIHLAYHKHAISRSEERPFSCVLVQTGLLPPEKTPLSKNLRSFISPYEQWRRILTMVSEANGKDSDLIVLPEAVVPFSCDSKIYRPRLVASIFEDVFGSEALEKIPEITFEERVSNGFWAQQLANVLGAEVILGLDHQQPDGIAHNSAFHVRPGQAEFDRYDKRVLMPLAEYLPLRLLTPLVKSYGISSFFTHGKEANLFEGKLPVSVSICYEETFPSKVREGRLKGAKLLVNVTNDGWYPNSRLPKQHFEHARFRAVENGSFLLRSCNTGITAVVDSLGKTACHLDEDTPSGALHASFIPYEYRTLFMLWGNKGIVCLCAFLAALFFALYRQLSW